MSEELLPEIQSVTLPERNDTEFPADGSRCIMVGWGCTARGKREKLVIPSFLSTLFFSSAAELHNKIFEGKCAMSGNSHAFPCSNSSWCVDKIMARWELVTRFPFHNPRWRPRLPTPTLTSLISTYMIMFQTQQNAYIIGA